MNKTLWVLRNEIVTILSRPSFWLGVLGLPLAAGLVFAVVNWVNRGSATAQALSQMVSGPSTSLQREGYVDPGGLITAIPKIVPDGTFKAFPDEAAAQSAMLAGEINSYYVISSDYMKGGEIRYVRPDFYPFAMGGDQSDLFKWVLQVNLLGGDIMKATLLKGPTEVQEISEAKTPISDQSNPMAMWAPYIMTLLFYMLIMSSASLLLGSISKEKENRIMEILLTSVTPVKLLTGKIIALGIIGLGQALIWLGMTKLLMNSSTSTFSLDIVFQLPPSFLAWGVVFFLLGFVVYASLLAGLGALAPNLREASQTIFVVMLPLMIPLFLGSTVFARWPHGTVAVFLSLFPLTSPSAMMARLAVGGVVWWHPWLATGLLLVTIPFIIRGVAGMFRAQTLLSGQEVNVKRYFRALLGKA